jgi:hypothetical protein
LRKIIKKSAAERRAARPQSDYLSVEERRAAGRASRDVAPRASHGGWKPPKNRRDPIELLHESNEAESRR